MFNYKYAPQQKQDNSLRYCINIYYLLDLKTFSPMIIHIELNSLSLHKIGCTSAIQVHLIAFGLHNLCISLTMIITAFDK